MVNYIDAIVAVNVTALTKDYPYGYAPWGDRFHNFLDKYCDLFVSPQYYSKPFRAKARIRCNEGDQLVFRAIPIAGLGPYVMISEFGTPEVKAADGSFVSLPRFHTTRGPGVEYMGEYTRIWDNWVATRATTVLAPERTDHVMTVTALRSTLQVNDGTPENKGTIPFIVGFKLYHDGAWREYGWDPRLEIRPEGTEFTET